MAVDPQTVTLQGTYRIGFAPPAEHSLTAGELYVEVGSGAPVLWIGTMDEAGFAGGLSVLGTAAAAPVVPPVNRDVPYVAQEGDTLTCTMGNWDGAPDTYAYQWALDGGDAPGGVDPATYLITAGDVGKSAACTVSATNSAGTTAAPVSNAVIVAPVATVETAGVAAEEYGPPMPPPKEPEPEEPEPTGRNHRRGR